MYNAISAAVAAGMTMMAQADSNVITAATSIYWTCGLVASGSIGMAGLITFMLKWMASRMDVKDTFIRGTMADVINNNSVALTKCADAMTMCVARQPLQARHDSMVAEHDRLVEKRDKATS
jgi:hypothetical protein